MTKMKDFCQKYPVLAYFVLTFALSWGALLMVIGPGGFLGTTELTEAQMPALFVAILVGPSGASLLLTGLVEGRAGYRELWSGLCRWRVSLRWYAVALLTAPLLATATLLGLSLFSPDFLPGIMVADDKASLLILGLTGGLAAGIFEELGWTGFAIPRLRQRYGVLTTGLIVGALWGAWHFPLFSSSGRDGGPLFQTFTLLVLLFSCLPAYRVLMVWVYGRTQSTLLAMIMHAALSVSTLIFQPLTPDGPMPIVIYDLVLGAVLWIIVAGIALASGGQLSRQTIRRRTV